MFKFAKRTLPLFTLTALSLCALTAFAQQKTTSKTSVASGAQYVLTDPVTGKVLANTPYVLITRNIKEADGKKVWRTDAQGRTRLIKGEKKLDLNDPETPVALVEAEGEKGHLLLLNLNDIVDSDEQKVGRPPAATDLKGAPYAIWNKNNNQTLCGHSNTQGFTQAYFVPPSSGWDKEVYLMRLKSEQPCSDVRVGMSKLFNGSDAEAFEQGYDYSREHFMLSEKQADAFIYQHVSDLIDDKSVNIDRGANKRMIDRAIDLARSKRDAGQLNMLGYSLGFERKAYKRGLPLLAEALAIKPDDCYFLNSKGYLLMRQGDLKESRKFLQASDVACQADRAKGGQDGKDTAYPIAVNYAHLAENYGLSGDAYMANEFFNRALKEGATRSKDEIIEVARNLGEKKILSPSNLQLFALYLAYVEKAESAKAGEAEGAAAADKARGAAKKPKKK